MKNDIYGEPDIITRGKNVANVYSPILTDKERERRMEIIKKAVAHLELSTVTKGK